MKVIFIFFTFISLFSSNLIAGEFTGDLVLYPENCKDTNSRICKLKGLLTYKSSTDNLVWQTDEWKDGNGQSGTTDGASIPEWAQLIIGDAYDESYLKAAIIHDHYCYEENYVRTWRQTHRMFYDALVDLGVNPLKSKIMYAAVYLGGPKWGPKQMVEGEGCGDGCIKSNDTSLIVMKDTFSSPDFQNKLESLKKSISKSPNISVKEIESLVMDLEPNNPFFTSTDSDT